MEKDKPPPPAKSGDTDWFLPSLLTTAKQAGQRPAVTLSVGGLLIAGELIGAQEYFAELAEQAANVLPGSAGGDAAARLEALFRKFAADASKAEEVDERSAHARPYFIHLRSARIYHPAGDPIPAQGGAMWRVRLDAVDGFTLGLPHTAQLL